MSFLFPLYLLGLAALTVPIVLHLRNRELKKRVAFSSLRFLAPTKIQQKQRSRLEHFLLLLLRCAILALFALAFARPFLKSQLLDDLVGETRQVVLLLDTSASMRHGDRWTQAVEQAKDIVDDLKETDELQLIAFDASPRIVHAFESWRSSGEGMGDRRASLQAKLEELRPSWQATNLGQALIAAVDAFQEARENPEEENPAKRIVYLLGDLQEGADTEVLADFSWPLDIELVPQAVGDRVSNASVQLLPQVTGIADLQDSDEQFRLINDRDSSKREFSVRWRQADGQPASEPLKVRLEPGETQIVTAPKTTTGIGAPVLALEGDDAAFDNAYYRSPPVAKPIRILYVGNDDPDSPDSALFFFKRALIETDTFKPELVQKRLEESLERIDWSLLDFVVLSDPATLTDVEPLREYASGGGRLLFLTHSATSVPVLGKLIDVVPLAAEEVTPPDFALLANVDRQHPYLRGFAEARYADFSRIHFWKYRKLDLSQMENVQVLATFDSGDPAWFELPSGQGRVLVFTSGWHRKDSQLALSTKFIPLIYSILTQDPQAEERKRTYEVGDAIPLPMGGEVEAEVVTPEGKTVTVEAGTAAYEGTDQPGLYTIQQGEHRLTVAVNLDPRESFLAPLEEDQLSRLLKLDREADNAATVKAEVPPADLSVAEEESRQKLWLWLLTAVLVLVLVEIVYSARCAGARTAAA